MIYGLEVGAIVRMRTEPDWGLGQVQSIVGSRVTVNFEHRGKVVLQGAGLQGDGLQWDGLQGDGASLELIALDLD